MCTYWNTGHFYTIFMSFQDTAELFFEDVRLPSSSILGGISNVNKGFYQLMNELSLERLLIADLGVAACEWMFEETREYVKHRKAFSKTIANLQVYRIYLFISLCVILWDYTHTHNLESLLQQI